MNAAQIPRHKIAHPAPPRDPWTQALSARDQLEATAVEQRTPAAYDSVLDNFRAIYHRQPAASKAPAAVAAVADLLAEKGRLFHDQRALQAAIGQYEFLRQQYPGSPQVANSLLLEAEICRQDLKDLPCAVDKLRQVVANGPDTSFGEQAVLELKDLEPPTKAAHSRSARNQAGSEVKKTSRPVNGSVLNAQTATATASPSTGIAQADTRNVPAQPSSLRPVPESAAQGIEAVNDPMPMPSSTSSTSHSIVLITGIRHWSNPTSTRIAIDLGGKVEYEAARVPDPDRIFFDLHGARLAPSLNGRQVEVIDDGYLKRIRAAQYHSDVTRVVLDVTDVSQYSAFLLPNPWRLIIDIHSDKGASATAIAQSKLSVVGAPDTLRSSPFQPGSQPTPAATANDAKSNGNMLADVAKLSSATGKIAATAGPTSGPVSAKVSSGQSAERDSNENSTDSNAPSLKTSPQPVAKSNSVAGQSSSTGKGSKSRKPLSNGATNSSQPEIADVSPELPHAADPNSDGQRSLVRALGLKVGRIVIDAGHGGHDSGTLGPQGIQEKDVVLDVALRVGTLLHRQLGAEIVYTRDTDIFIPLETRTAIANKAQADLFLSIHANSSSEPSARGVETYYLNFTSDPGALDVAARENAVSTQSVHQLSDLVRKITLKDKIDESREFAADVDEGLYAGLKAGNPGLKDRGVKKAPFVVLIGAQMPSILAEISFLTNPDDAQKLKTGAYRQRIAESLVTGVERYLRGLSGLRPSERAKNSSAVGQ